MAYARICGVAGCGNEYHAKDLCHVHYKRALRSGEIVRVDCDNRGRTCSAKGCEAQAKTLGLCHLHYGRFRKYGSTELKPAPQVVKLFKPRPRWFITDIAVPYTGDDCLIWPFSRNDSGYATYRHGATHSASRAVCILVHGEPPTPDHESAHSCGKGHLGCINPNHLSWKTRVENQADRLVHGTDMRGDRGREVYSHSRTYLAAEQVAEIVDLEGVMSQSAIAKIYGIHRTHVGRIHRGDRRRQKAA